MPIITNVGPNVFNHVNKVDTKPKCHQKCSQLPRFVNSFNQYSTSM